MRVPAFVCVLALVASVFCTGESVEFGASIPVGFFEGFYNRLVFPLLDDYSKGFGRNFPSDCCYKGRGVKIQVTNLTEHGLNADSVVTSDANGISTVTQMGVAWDFHFKLCTAIGCTPLFSCNDDVELQFTLTTQSTLEASATGEGKLNLSSSDSTLKLAISYGDLCDTVKKILADVVADVNDEFSIIFPKLVNALLGAIGDALSLNLQFGDANVQFLYSNSETGTTNGGLVAGGSVPVTNVKTGKEGTFTPSSPLPDLLTTPQPPNEEELYIADSIPNNILQVLFEETIPDHFTLDVDLQGNLFKLHIKLRESPQVSFSSEGNSILIKTREVVQNGLLRIDFNVDTQIFFGFGHNQNKVFLTLSPDNFVFDVEFLPPVDPLQNITELIDQIVEAQWNKYIPILDEFLAAHPIPLPPLPFFQFPGTENFDGYTRIFVENNPQTSEEVSFSSLAAGYPKTAAILNGMAQGVGGPSRKFFQLFGEKLAQTLDDLSLETPREGRTVPNGKKGFYCPLIIPGFSLDDCPEH